ncbi:Stress response protein YsnF [Rubripirellula obstinata]|uniref:Stress response protein YsnF n=1 Tax=Rubripirellula obstinata TaxID=406547 RepID=A0A5B1CPF5_9BACT|nr:DUF2382 domain-containing protein [Rubripirellula obstinata]KAA1261164.1 Stress response protein YsnF [Rubripirellula obstinata]
MATQTARNTTASNTRHNTKHTNRETVVGVFHSHAEAQKAVRDLKNAGFTEEQIGIAAKDHDGSYGKQTKTEGNHAAEGATAGAVGGLGAGALWGLGIVAGALPAVGPVIAGGALAAVAASAAGTAAAGGLIGALVGLGIPEEEAEYYESEFNRGRTVVTVKAGKDKYHKASCILDDSNSYDYDRRESDHASNPKAKQRVNTDGKMVARKEVLDVDKTTDHHAGSATVRKEVTSDTKHVEVPVKREELVVERTDMDGRAAGPITGRDTDEERITLKEEEVDVNKRTVAKEGVKVGKRTVTDHETVQANVKEENIVVDRDGSSNKKN